MAAGIGVLAIFLADAGLDIVRNTLIPSRRRAQPCGPMLRPLAAAESCLIKGFSESGRLWGHLRRGYWQGVCRNFDWFCGRHPGKCRRRYVVPTTAQWLSLPSPMLNLALKHPMQCCPAPRAGVVRSEQRRSALRAFVCIAMAALAIDVQG